MHSSVRWYLSVELYKVSSEEEVLAILQAHYLKYPQKFACCITAFPKAIRDARRSLYNGARIGDATYTDMLFRYFDRHGMLRKED